VTPERKTRAGGGLAWCYPILTSDFDKINDKKVGDS